MSWPFWILLLTLFALSLWQDAINEAEELENQPAEKSPRA